MAKHVAFLRGINVGGHRASKQQLCGCFEDCGFTEASTFRASGNVIFDSSARRSAKLVAQIERELEKTLGYGVPTFVRTANEVKAISAQEPFTAKQVEKSKGKIQVAMLLKKPSAAASRKVLALATDQDAVAIEATELYWLPSGGMSDSNLDLKLIEKMLGPITIRTKGTVELIAAKL